MANEHPFQLLFETLGRVPAAHAESVNRQAYVALSEILSMPLEKTGRCILLRAPRAGHGKTHLLSRIQHQLGASYEFIPLHAVYGCRIDAKSVTGDTLRRLVRQLPASGGLTVLDLVTRRLFASALQPLVASGEVPCQDREGALTALRARPVETFDFHHPNAVTAHWARENFEVLGQRLSVELAQRADLSVSEVAFWVDALFRFAAAPLENTGRVRTLSESVHAASGAEMDRLEALLGLVTLLMRVVLVADDLEGFSADESAALKLAAFLGSLRQSVERLDVVLSLNRDIWESAFLPRLSGGLADRLSEVVVELEPLTQAEMVELLDSRVPGLGSRVLERIDLSTAGTHARGLIRAAGLVWLKASAMDSAPAAIVVVESPPSPVVVPPPESVAEALPEPVPFFVPTPPVDSPAFTFSPDEPSEFIEEPVTWPSPEFNPARMMEIETEEVIYQPPVDSPFQVESPEPAAATFAPPEWQGAPPPFAPQESERVPTGRWDLPAPEPVLFYPPVDSPFQIEPPVQIPDSPQTAFGTQEWQGTATTPAPHPAEMIPDNSWAPAAEIATEPAPYYAPVESPSRAAPPQFTMEPSATAFAPPEWQDAAPFATHPESWPSGPAQSPAGSPFQVDPEPAFSPQPYPQGTYVPPQQAAEVAPPPTTADTDRVDDLLRQFRERYGRGSL